MSTNEPQFVSLKGIVPNAYALWMALFALSFIIFLASPVFKIGAGAFSVNFTGNLFVGWLGYGLLVVSLVCIATVVVAAAKPYCKLAKLAFLVFFILTLLYLVFNFADVINMVRQSGSLPRNRAPVDLIGFGAFFLPFWFVFGIIALIANPAKNLHNTASS